METAVSEHIVSPKVYVTIFFALMIGTIVTVLAAFQNLHAWNIVVALGIATMKATLVVLFFMHAKYSPGRTKIVIVSAVFWLGIMLVLTLSDYETRTPMEGRVTSPAPAQILNV